MEKVNLNRILRDLEIEYIKKALYETGENITNAADLLGLNRTALVMRLTSLGITTKHGERRKLDKGKSVVGLFPNNPNNIEDQLWSK